MQLSVAERASQAHGILRQSGTVPSNLLAFDIYESWLRCVALGLDSTRAPPIDMASPGVLRSEQEQRVLLRGLALAEMRTLHDQIAGSNFLIAFATPEGLLLDIVADKSFADTREAKNIRPSSLWSESLCGTNGIGTAAFVKRPVVVHGSEHYFPSFNSLTCAASPIFAPDGSLAGILDASSDCVSRQTHTAALPESKVEQILGRLIGNGLAEGFRRIAGSPGFSGYRGWTRTSPIRSVCSPRRRIASARPIGPRSRRTLSDFRFWHVADQRSSDLVE
jgi:transcriptional regulator of acetoin/glycerol metabolism